MTIVGPTAEQLSLEGQLVVRDILGEERPVVHQWPNDYECPFCHAPVQKASRGCGNPGCTARVDERTGLLDYPRERAERDAAARAARLSEEADRLANLEWSRQYHEERRAERAAHEAEQIAIAKTKGACLRCLFKNGEFRPPTFIKHRGVCPLTKK